MKLNEFCLEDINSKKKAKRVGRGDGSGHGGTSCRGHKGQKARAGGYHKPGFEGGQMPLIRRLPKRGFCNIFKTKYTVINLEELSKLPEGTDITPELLAEKKIVKFNKGSKLAVLGRGELTHALNIKASRFSASAKKKIEDKGGKAEVISG